MTTENYQFESIHSATSSIDGEHVILSVTGAGGVCGLSLPAKTIPHACAAMLEANAEARRRTGDKTIQASELRAMNVLEHPDPSKVVLAITIHTGAAPIGFALSETLLVAFAQGVLERRGLLPTERPRTHQ